MNLRKFEIANGIRDLQENRVPIFKREGWLCQPSLLKMGTLLIRRSLNEKNSNEIIMKGSGFWCIVKAEGKGKVSPVSAAPHC